LSAFVVSAFGSNTRRIFVPSLSLVAASAQRAGLGEHIGALPVIEVVTLDLTSALTVGALVAKEVDWRIAHAAQVGRPDPEWPTGRPVLTRVPDAYAGLGVDAITV
jgi:hypothetical protein